MKIFEIGNESLLYLIVSQETASFPNPSNGLQKNEDIEEEKGKSSEKTPKKRDAENLNSQIKKKYSFTKASRDQFDRKSQNSTDINFFIKPSEKIVHTSINLENDENFNLNQGVKVLSPIKISKEMKKPLNYNPKEELKSFKTEYYQKNSEDITEEFIKNTIMRKNLIVSTSNQTNLNSKKAKLNRQILLKETLLLDDYACPICLELLKDSYNASDGFSYHFECIKLWFENHDTSPMTNCILKSKEISKNILLNKTIREKEEEINSIKKQLEELNTQN